MQSEASNKQQLNRQDLQIIKKRTILNIKDQSSKLERLKESLQTVEKSIQVWARITWNKAIDIHPNWRVPLDAQLVDKKERCFQSSLDLVLTNISYLNKETSKLQELAFLKLLGLGMDPFLRSRKVKVWNHWRLRIHTLQDPANITFKLLLQMGKVMRIAGNNFNMSE